MENPNDGSLEPIGADFIPALTSTDWAEEWKQLQIHRHAADNSAYWDEKSKTFRKSRVHSPYAERFLELANIEPDESVLDMGCGNGALAIPLAIAGHDVIAADFSEGMLDSLLKDAAQHGTLSITTKHMSWADDWDAHGVTENCVDVAVASRSIATADLRESLAKLSRSARKKCCITLPTGSSPRADERILSAIGIDRMLGRDFIYAFMILLQMGYYPEVKYIESSRIDTFDSTNEAYESLSRMVEHASYEMLPGDTVKRALARLRSWLEDNLIQNPNAGVPDSEGVPEKAFILRTPRNVTWAFISWSVQQDQKECF